MRAAEMGLDRATRKDVRPTDTELASMEAQLTEALDAGFVGMSTQQLMFDKLDGETCRSRTLPSTYATKNDADSTRSCAAADGYFRPDLTSHSMSSSPR